ncbi:hypothetical protein B0J18DRAFT_362725 [Chaetomium sp. MPI-SDFR-AT-0129]|nr:hypothetical protein B0J18DRAFT_362725 [Chaetomium sp. MPI-SDFR-AT-0129]
MRAPRAASSLLALLAASRHALGEEISDVPPVKEFLRRGGVSATVIGDYVYIDGGEMSQLLDGLNLSESGRISVPVNSTISIDISKSWTSSDAVLRPILRPWGSKSNQVIWTDHEKDTFYVWGGKWIQGANMTANELWKFTADGSGGGAWSKELPANPALFNSLEEYEYGVSVSTNTTGFSMGGVASGWTRLYRASNQVITGMVAFDMNTKLWYNGTTEWSPFNTITAGSAHWVPIYGPNGLVMVFGGISMPIDSSDWVNATPLDFRNITFFDPDTKQKYTQVTTGDVPSSPRGTFCVTGFQNKGGGYEIFLFGGYNDRDKIMHNDAYVLSLPGFVWTKLPDSPDGGRRSHSCLAVGNRQVLSIGGTQTGWEDADPAPQGLALFDMVDWKWKHAYDANAKAYVRAPKIKKWYDDGYVSPPCSVFLLEVFVFDRLRGLDSVDWSSDEVRKLFVTKSTSQTGTSTE